MVIVFLILSVACFGMAGICNSVMDTLKYHYNNSFFCKKFGVNNSFWNEDAKDAKPYMIPHTKYKFNAWHLFKSAMVVLLAISCCFIFLAGVKIDTNPCSWILVLGFALLLLAYGIVWNGMFNLFFNNILIVKK